MLNSFAIYMSLLDISRLGNGGNFPGKILKGAVGAVRGVGGGELGEGYSLRGRLKKEKRKKISM